MVLAFSGGGTRAAAFSYGVLEFLKSTEVVAPNGAKLRLIDAVDMITGVSGGSFTALAYGLYGEKLFADYEQRFLKRDVQGELVSRAFNPKYWGDYIGGTAGRSELAANFYDEILFNGATFGDLDRGDGPFIVASATDISTGSRVPFNQSVFNLLCSDLNAVRLSRAAAASSAVPVVLSTVTLNNYGGSCGYEVPAWVKMFTQSDESTAAGGARDTRAERGPGPCRRHEPALHPPGGRRHLRQRGHARRARCAAVARSLARCGHPDAARPCEADRRAGRQLAVVAPDHVGHLGTGARHGGRVAASPPACRSITTPTRRSSC